MSETNIDPEITKLTAKQATQLGNMALVRSDVIIVYRKMSDPLETPDVPGFPRSATKTEDGKVAFTVNSPSQEGQGDHGYLADQGSEPGADITSDPGFTKAAELAYPNGKVYKIEAPADSILKPYPDAPEDHVYIKNGTQVTSEQVPKEVLDKYYQSVNSASQ